MSTRAYGKLIMHAAKYPSCAINGLLLAKREDLRPGGSARVIKYTDCVPLFHLAPGLTPMLEVALTQVESQAEESGLVVAGLYHAHDNIRDTHIDVFSQRIADKIAENQSGTVVATLDSKKLSLSIDSHALIIHQHIEGKWRPRSSSSLRLEHEAVSLACASALLKKKIYRDLVDFDNHLDDLAQDYLNVELNMEIDSCL